MTQPKTEYQEFDTLALEEKLDQDYCLNNSSFSDGEWDAKVSDRPNPEAWVTSADYRKGYLFGIEEKYNDQFAQLF